MPIPNQHVFMKTHFTPFLMLFVLCTPYAMHAAPASHIVMSEIQIGATGFSTDEFIELHNPTDVPIDITGWQLVKRTASGGAFPLVDAFAAGTIPAHGYFLVAHPTGYRGAIAPDARYTTVNSISADNSVELVNSLGVVDVVGWGTASHVENASAPTPGSGKSIERKALATSTKETMGEDGADSFRGNGEDTDTNSNDWISRDLPEPQNTTADVEFVTAPAPIIPPTQTNTNTNTAPTPPLASPSTTPVVPAASSPHTLVITEFLPDPKGADAGEEFIEILNTGETPVDLVGWKVQDASSSKYTFSTGNIAPGAYRAVKRPESGIALNNTNGETVSLTAPDGFVTSTASFSGSAIEGQSFSLFENQWKWTGTPTPGAKNLFADGNHVPEARIKDVETNIRIRTTVHLSAAPSTDPDGDDVEFRWSFSDGSTATGTKVAHAFSKSGKITVTLTATDAKGKQDTEKMVFNVKDYDRSTEVIIVNALPNPAEGEEEYVELSNSGTKDVDLAGWVLRNGTRIMKLQEVIAAQSKLRLDAEALPFALRNDGATLELLDPDEKVVSTLTYAKVPAGTVVSATSKISSEQIAAATNTSSTSGKVAGETTTPKNANQPALVQSPQAQKDLPLWSWVAIGGVAVVGWVGYEVYRKRRK